MRSKKIQAIDLFCGGGGLSLGLKQAGINVIAGIDLEKACKYPYETNIGAKFVHASVKDITGKDLAGIWDKDAVRLLAGCAPCQPFSSQKKGRATTDHVSWDLLDDFARLIKQSKPEYVTMENVTPLRGETIFLRFLETLKTLGYDVKYGCLKAEEYGLPQRRRRLVLIASRLGEIQLPTPTRTPENFCTVRDAIGDLPPLRAGQSSDSDPLHKARCLSEINLKRLRASKPGGTWQDWPEKLIAPCHKRASGASFKSFYGRMIYDQPAPTITTQFYNYGSGRFGHPTQDRTLTPREAAIIQGFPADYVFYEPTTTPALTTLGKIIGNAVPPVFGKEVGKQILAHLASK